MPFHSAPWRQQRVNLVNLCSCASFIPSGAYLLVPAVRPSPGDHRPEKRRRGSRRGSKASLAEADMAKAAEAAAKAAFEASEASPPPRPLMRSLPLRRRHN